MTFPPRDVDAAMIIRPALEPETPTVAVAHCSRDFHVTWVNPGFATWLRRPAGDVVGRPIGEVLGEEAFLALWPFFERALAGEAIDREHEIGVRDIGRRWVSASYTPTRDQSGVIDGWITALVDVTRLKVVQEELLRHAMVVESTDDAVLSRSLNGLILSWNNGARRLFGYADTEVLGRPSSIIVPDDLVDEEESILARVRNGEHIEGHETRRMTKGGRCVDVSVTISPYCNRRGEIIGACDVARDITARKRAERSLLWRLEFERELSELSRTIISLPDDEIDANIERALARIGVFLDVDRVTLYESRTMGEFSVRSFWMRPGVGGPPQALTPSELPWWTQRTMRGEMSLFTRPGDLPDEAAAERELFRRAGILSAASIPLNVGGEITGVLSFATIGRRVSWTDDIVGLLRVFGDIISSALKRRRAMEDLRVAQAMSRDSEQRFTRRLIRAQEEERAAVGRELHDDIIQRLTLAMLNLEAIRGGSGVPVDVGRELAKVVESLVELGSDIQALSHRLHSAKLEHLGLRATTAGFCREVAAKHNVPVAFRSEGMADDLPTDSALCLFRVLQEAVQNALKHSGAAQISVSLAAGRDNVTLTVSDEGKGFIVRDALAADGIGLSNMHERLRLAGGVLSIESAPGRGTLVCARVPRSTGLAA